MTDNTKNRGEPDRSHISLGQAHEVAYWTRELGLSPSELRAAVVMAGSSPDDVRRFVNRRR
jgi:hypothetical protein